MPLSHLDVTLTWMPIQISVIHKIQTNAELGLSGHCLSKDTKTARKTNLAVGEQSHKRNPKVQRNLRDHYFFLKMSYMYPDIWLNWE